MEPITDLETGFGRVASQWRRVLEEEFLEWSASLEAMREQHRRLRQQGLWVSGPVDFLGVLHRTRLELDHSKLVGWLLDPCMHHGLGTRVLERVLRRCFPGEPLPELSGASTEYEVAREGCRADIIVWAPRLTLVIENKVDASESPQQCDGLYERFEDEPQPHFIFLTPEGRSPITATGEAREAFRPLSYSDLGNDLATALNETASLPPWKARSVAEGYLETLGRQFS